MMGECVLGAARSKRKAFVFALSSLLLIGSIVAAFTAVSIAFSPHPNNERRESRAAGDGHVPVCSQPRISDNTPVNVASLTWGMDKEAALKTSVIVAYKFKNEKGEEVDSFGLPNLKLKDKDYRLSTFFDHELDNKYGCGLQTAALERDSCDADEFESIKHDFAGRFQMINQWQNKSGSVRRATFFTGNPTVYTIIVSNCKSTNTLSIVYYRFQDKIDHGEP